MKASRKISFRYILENEIFAHEIIKFQLRNKVHISLNQIAKNKWLVKTVEAIQSNLYLMYQRSQRPLDRFGSDRIHVEAGS